MKRLVVSLAAALITVTSVNVAQAACCEIGKCKYTWNKCVPDAYQCREHRNGYFFKRCGKCRYPDYQYGRVGHLAPCQYGLSHKKAHYRGFYRVYNHEGLSYEIYTR
ncbi:MAG: hypothetical protein AB7I18_07855 [Candidatus Berkiella sp.]